MTSLQIILLFGCVALGVFFLADALFYYFGNNQEASRKRIERRLAGKGKGIEKKKSGFKREIEEDNERFFIDHYLRRQLRLAGNDMTTEKLYFFSLALTFAFAGLLYVFLPVIPLLGGLSAGLIVSLLIVVVVLKRQIKARNYKFEEQFPDAIDLIVRSLRVGQPFTKAVQAVASEMPDPVATEFRITSQEIAYGRDLPGALDDMLERVTVTDLRFFVVAVQIQHEAGGNLAEILENLSRIIRGRFRLMRKVKALTVEGRFSAWFLSIFPVVMILVMNAINPGYYTQVMDFEYFNHLAALTLFLLLTNVIAMRIMTKLEV